MSLMSIVQVKSTVYLEQNNNDAIPESELLGIQGNTEINNLQCYVRTYESEK